MKRPELSRALTPEQFQENYYLKEELQAFLKACGVSAAGSKADLNERILQILHGNAICSAVKQRKVKNNRTDTLCPDSIIEKDLAAGLLAEELNADTLLILTSVENVSLNHGQVNEQKLGSITVADAKKYIEENQFASGSMLPKIEAGISFIEKGEGRSTVITDMAHAKEGYEGKTGTTIR